MPVEAQRSAMRISTRLANGFVLDLFKRASFGMDVQDTVLIAAITQANLSHLSRDPELQRRYASLSTPMDDALRRPISVNAIAASLRMPFETVRRRVARMAEFGAVEISARGVTVPSGPLGSAAYDMAARANYELVHALYERLTASGLDLPHATTVFGGGFSSDDPPIRLVARISADYALRLVEPIATHLGDLVAGMLLMDVIQANTEHFPLDPLSDAALELGPEGFPADHLRRPVRTVELGRRLGLPPETVRRKMLRLVARDRCVPGPKGYIVPGRVLAGEPLWSITQDNRAQLLRLFATLADYGVLDLWRTEGEGLRGAA